MNASNQQNNRIEKQRQQDFNIDETLFVRIAEDDREAFRELYLHTERAVYVFALSLLKDPDDASDVVQDTFLKIRSAAHLYQPMGKPMAWIYTITRNLAISKIRQRQKIADADWEEESKGVYSSQITNTEDRIVLETAMRVLTDDDAQIILLHVVSGYKHREIAKLMDLPLSTVLSKYNRGLKKLKRTISEQEYENES